MDACTLEEAKEQTNRLNVASEKEFAEEAPMIRKRLKTIKTPLKFRDAANIYLWIFRKQISLENLPENLRDEFSKSFHYGFLKRGKKL